MTPVYQTKFGYRNGNCFQATVASLLDLQLEEVPDFVAIPDPDIDEENDSGKVWLEEFFNWLYPRNLVAVLLEVTEGELSFVCNDPIITIGRADGAREAHAIITKLNPETKEFDIVHDPHPNQHSLRGFNAEYFIIVSRRLTL